MFPSLLQGALVHFSESSQGPNLTTSTPWIAFISCDRNETNASQLDGGCRGVKRRKTDGQQANEDWVAWTMLDIFTLVRDRGAVAAVSSRRVFDSRPSGL